MGKEFAGAVGRWSHLEETCAKPKISVCDTNQSSMDWFCDRIPGIRFKYTNYKEMLENDEIDAVYCAVPHEQIYVDIIESGKHFMGEKPFGMDM